MDIKNFNTKQEYNLEPKPTTESVVSHINEGNQVKFDGVNVETQTPTLGDAVYKDAGGVKHAFKAEGFAPLLLPADYTYEGVFIGYYKDGRWQVFMGNYNSLPSYKYADVVQFTISAISATSITFYLKMAGDYANFVQIDVTLTSAEINATSASEINAALEAAGNTDNVGYDKHKYWAYLADDNGNPVESGGTKIIVQCDSWMDYRQYQCSDSTHALVGLTMTHTTWGDMPENSSAGFRINGRSSNEHIMNVAGGASYYGTNGRTPSANVPLNEAADIVKKADFETSAYCALLRQTYGTYENYIRKEYTLLYPQKLGVFRLPDGETLTKKYGPMTAIIKNGTTKAKFPALNWAYQQGGHLWDVSEGTVMMLDENLAAINAIQTKVGKVVLSNSTTRWFAERSYVYNAWFFSGYYRYLGTYHVTNAYQCGAVTLL